MQPYPAWHTNATGNATRDTHHTMALGSAWFSLILPLLATGWLVFVQPMFVLPPEVMYWGLFACGVVSLLAGCFAISGIGRRIEWAIMTPALLGIVFSAILSYVCLGFGILGAGPPNMNMLPRGEGNVPAVRHG
jgi:hypothetical protein